MNSFTIYKIDNVEINVFFKIYQELKRKIEKKYINLVEKIG